MKKGGFSLPPPSFLSFFIDNLEEADEMASPKAPSLLSLSLFHPLLEGSEEDKKRVEAGRNGHGKKGVGSGRKGRGEK